MTTKMDTSWRDLLVLLRGRTNVVQSCDAIVDAIRQNLSELPDVVHEVAFGLLVSTSMHIRANGATLLGKLAHEFGPLFQKLVEDSASDGSLLRLEDLDVARIEQNSSSFFVHEPMTTSGQTTSIYTKEWLRRQRKELRKRIGQDGEDEVLAAATEYDGVEGCIQESDLLNPVAEAGTSTPLEGIPVQLNVTHTRTKETWLARILRCMIVGLLDHKWEVRHGYSLGLTSMLQNMATSSAAPGGNKSGSDISVPSTNSCVLPCFLCDDIMCCGICVLLLDRLLDFGAGAGGEGALSPVKEAAGELILSALRCHSTGLQRHLVWKIIQDMVTLKASHWTTTLGGYIALKHFLSVHTRSLGTAEDMAVLVQLLRAGWQTGALEDIAIAALDCVTVLGEQLALDLMDTTETADTVLSMGTALAASLRSEAGRLLDGASPSLVRGFSSAWGSLCGVASSLALKAKVAEAQKVVGMCTDLLRAQTSLLSVLYGYDDNVRNGCWAEVASSLRSLQIAMGALVDSGAGVKSNNAELLEELHSFLGALVASACFASSRPEQELLLVEAGSGAKGSASAAAAVRRKRGRAEVAVALATSTSAELDGSARGEEGSATESRGRGSGGALVVMEQYYADRRRWTEIVAAWVDCTGAASQLGGSVGSKGRKKASLEFDQVSVAQALLRTVFGQEQCGRDSSSVMDQLCRRFKTVLGAFTAREGRTTDGKGTGAGCLHLLAEESQCRLAVFISRLLAVPAQGDQGVKEVKNLTTGGGDAVSAVEQTVGAAASSLASALVMSHDPSVAGGSGGATGSTAAPAEKKRKFRFVVVPDKPSAVAPTGGEGATDMGQTTSRGASTGMGTGTVAGTPTAVTLLVVTGLCAVLVELRGSLGLACTYAVAELQRTLEAGKPGAEQLQTMILLRQALASASVTTVLSQSESTTPLKAHIAHHIAAQLVMGHATDASVAHTAQNRVTVEAVTRLAAVGAMPLLYAIAQAEQLECFVRPPAVKLEGIHSATIAGLEALNCVLRALTTESLWQLLCDDSVVQVLAALLEASTQEQQDRAVAAALGCVDALFGHKGHGDALALHYLANHFLRALSRKPHTMRPTDIPGQANNNVAAVAQVLLSVVSSHADLLLPEYDTLFAAALRGLADFDNDVRRPCVQAFKQLVPLATLAQAMRSPSGSKECGVEASLHRSEDGSLPARELLDHIFTKKAPLRLQHSTHPLDQRIMSTLARDTNLVAKSSHGAQADLFPSALREYQWAGVSWLTQLRRFGLSGILADEMGLGKSLQALTALAVLRIEKAMHTAPFLVVCPASVALHWFDETQRFFPATLLSPLRYSEVATGSAVPHAGSVVIVSYEMLRRDISQGATRGVLGGRLWEAVVLDEAHLIKNPAAGTTRAVYALKSLHRIALSGTPVQNQVEELWSLMNFLLPDYLGDRDTFAREVVRPIQRSFTARKELLLTQDTMIRQAEEEGGSGEDDTDTGKRSSRSTTAALARFHQAIELSATGLHLLRNLHKQVLPFILRRTKDQVARDLPSKTVVDILCPLSAVQQQMYREYLSEQRTSDDILEQEVARLQADSALDPTLLAIVGRSARENAGAPQPAATTVATNMGLGMPALEEEDFPPIQLGQPAVTATATGTARSKTAPAQSLKTINYLKQLCVHPAMVVEGQHSRYRNRLLQAADSSGKLGRLAVLLLEGGVVARDECSDLAAVEALGSLDGDVNGRASTAASSRNRLGDSSDSDTSAQEEEAGGCNSRGGEGEEDRDDSQGRPAKRPRRAASEQSLSKGGAPKQQTAAAEAEGVLRDRLAAASDSVILQDRGETAQHRCLIFAQHKATLDLVEQTVLRRYFPGVGYARLDGDMEAAKRAAVAKRFNEQAPLDGSRDAVGEASSIGDADSGERVTQAQYEQLKRALPSVAAAPAAGAGPAVPGSASSGKDKDQDIRVLLMTTRACGLGLTLTAADTVVFVEHDWNPFADLQAMDRVHRLGQTKPVTVYRLLAEATIEARIMKLQGLKKAVVSEIINEENTGDGGQGGKTFASSLMDSLRMTAPTQAD